MDLIIVVLILGVAAIAAWNFIPGIRERLRGLTTIFDSLVIGGFPFVANIIDGFQETNWKEYISPDHWPYIMVGMAGWVIFKRIVTSTPVGKRQ